MCWHADVQRFRRGHWVHALLCLKRRRERPGSSAIVPESWTDASGGPVPEHSPVPSAPGEIKNPSTSNRESFGREQPCLYLGMTAEAAQVASRRNHAMVGEPGFVCAAHDLSDSSRRSWAPGQAGDVAVRDDPPGRYPPQDVQDPPGERRGRGSDGHGATIL